MVLNDRGVETAVPFRYHPGGERIELGRFDFLLMKTWWDWSTPFGKIAREILRYSRLGFG